MRTNYPFNCWYVAALSDEVGAGLLARRLLERGVRMVQLWHGAGQPWDNHDNIETNHRKLSNDIDQPIAALLSDLKQRGMLEDTLVIWGGEFGRTPMNQGGQTGDRYGRDHHGKAFSICVTTVDGKLLEVNTARAYLRMRTAARRGGP